MSKTEPTTTAPPKTLKGWIEDAKVGILMPVSAIKERYVDDRACPLIIRGMMKGLISSTLTADEVRNRLHILENSLRH